jgi:hypothetical protein
MIFAVAVFSVWLRNGDYTYLYASIGFFISGVLPTLRRLQYFFSPPKNPPIIQEAPPKSRGFPWVEASAVLSFLAGVLGLAKELISMFASK